MKGVLGNAIGAHVPMQYQNALEFSIQRWERLEHGITEMIELSQAFLEKLKEHQAQPEQVLDLFQTLDPGFKKLKAFSKPAGPSEPYSRCVLTKPTDDVEVMLARWSSDKACSPHDHGFSRGWVFYLEGTFSETSYTWNNQDLSVSKTVKHDQGTHTEVETEEIHSCVCDSSGLSLHIYFPRIQGMRVFDLLEKRTLVVRDHCGAWIPAEPSDCVKETKWIPSAASL